MPGPTIPNPVAVEARAKLTWGESTEKVRSYLMAQGVGEKDSSVFLADLVSERAAYIRSDERKNLWIGSAFIAAPIAYYFVTHLFIGYWNLKAFSALIVLAIVGFFKIASGISMIVSPKSVRGDQSNAKE